MAKGSRKGGRLDGVGKVCKGAKSEQRRRRRRGKEERKVGEIPFNANFVMHRGDISPFLELMSPMFPFHFRRCRGRRDPRNVIDSREILAPNQGFKVRFVSSFANSLEVV